MKTKTDRVVLNLTQDQAKQLKGFIYMDGLNNPNVEKSNKEFLEGIYKRLEKTIIKNIAIDTLRKNGAEPTKEEVRKAMEMANGK